jgi:hypothetical protein
MKPIPVEQIVRGLSEDVQDLLVREAYIRKRQETTRQTLAEKRQQAATLEESRPPFLLLRRKETRAGFQSTAQKLEAEIAALEKVAANCEIILEKTARILEAEVEEYFQANREEFRNASNAARLVPEWEAAIGILRSNVRQFVVALAVAQNLVASRDGSAALKALDTAVSAARTLETDTAVPNRLAKSFRELLGLDSGNAAPAIVPLPLVALNDPTIQVTALTTMPLELAEKRLGPMIVQWNAMHEQGVNALLEELARVRASQAEYQAQHIAGPLAQLRAMGDSMVDEAHADSVYASMESRFVTLTG